MLVNKKKKQGSVNNLENAEQYMEPVQESLFLIVHKNILVVKGQYYKIQKAGIVNALGNKNKNEAAKNEQGNPVARFDRS